MAKILVVEDDPVTRALLGHLLSKWGHVAIFSPNGQHALEALEVNEDICLIVADVMMPVMDGKEMVRILRGKDGFCSLPVILVSSIVGPKCIADLLSMGMIRFLPKPIDGATLEECVRCALEVPERF